MSSKEKDSMLFGATQWNTNLSLLNVFHCSHKARTQYEKAMPPPKARDTQGWAGGYGNRNFSEHEGQSCMLGNLSWFPYYLGSPACYMPSSSKHNPL